MKPLLSAKSRLRLSLVVSSLPMWLSSCGEERPLPHETGQVEFQLRGSGISGGEYRLRDAVVMVQGSHVTMFFDSEDDPTRTSWSSEVPVGTYDAVLQEGWRLDRVVDDRVEPVSAELLSANPLSFEVLEAQTTTLSLRFRLSGEHEPVVGSFEIALEVVDNGLPDGLCASQADCRAGETCCISGFLGKCLGLDAEPCPLPDLTVWGAVAGASIGIEEESFAASSCAIEEGCVGGPGVRRLMRFSTYTPNIGNGDLILGNPEGGDAFEWAECHQHYHFSEYAEFSLLDADGETVAVGRKQAFCLLDSEAYVTSEDTAESPRFHCGFQGIQAGWADVYDANLDCQWIDVTDVEPGNYVLRLEVNPARVLPESDYDNNVVEVPVVLTPPQVEDPISPCAFPAFGLFRDCGWSVAEGYAGASCSPGDDVSVTCGCAGTPVCSGDALIRACPGNQPCVSSAAIAMSDDACGTCPGTQFRCPPSGSYTVLIGDYSSRESFTCDVQVVDDLYPPDEDD